MIQELQEVILKVEQLKDEEQREIAKLLQEEMSWDESFKKSQNQLDNLADEAIRDFQSGKTTKTDW